MEPVFSNSGNTVAGNVLTRNGTNAVNILVDKNSVKQETFNLNDQRGNYQATIYCTSAAL